MAQQENRVRGQVLEAQLTLVDACTPLKATQSGLSVDLLAMLDAELARRAAAAGKAPATANGVSSGSAAAGAKLPPRRPAGGNGARGGDGPADHGADAGAAGMPGAARRHRQNGTQPPPVRRAA